MSKYIIPGLTESTFNKAIKKAQDQITKETNKKILTTSPKFIIACAIVLCCFFTRLCNITRIVFGSLGPYTI